MQEFFEHTVFIRTFLLVFSFLLLSCYFVKKMTLTILPFALVRFLVTPGVIIHELSHALGCFVTGAKVDSINVFDKNGGSVKHGDPSIKFIGPIVISMAPVVGGLVLYYCWSLVIDTPFSNRASSTYVMAAIESFFTQLGQIHWLDWPIWLYLYGCLNLMIGIGPSIQDFSNCKWELPLALICIGILEYIGLFSGAGLASFVCSFVIPLVLMALFFLILLMPFYLFVKK